jgi:hypothetical protein
VVGILAAAGAACSSGSHGAGPDGASPDGAATDGPSGDAPTTSRRSFVVTSTITLDPPAATAGAIPATHDFTLVLDGDVGRAWLGAEGSENVTAFTTAGGAIHLADPVYFNFSCGNQVTYSDLTFTVDASGGVTGQGRGKADYIFSDYGGTSAATMSLAGVADTVAPMFTTTSSSPVDPFTAVFFVSSEPLPATTSVAMLAGDGTRTMLEGGASNPKNTGNVLSLVHTPDVLLPFGQTFDVQTAGTKDFAGNQAAGDLQFTTVAAPPVIPEDGFESAAGTMVGGALVLGDGNGAVIAGAKSLYLPAETPPIGGFGGQPPGFSLLLRLAVAPGDTVVRFSYRVVGDGLWPGFAMGSVGAAPAFFQLIKPAGPTTTYTLPLGAMSAVGPVLQAEIPLPPTAHDEIFIERYTGSGIGACGGGAPPAPDTAGIIIDDLRVE